jgi:general secretion pathway protein J
MRTRGFTLVEVLVALMVMALLAVMAWQGVDGIMRTRQRSQTRLDQVLRMNTVLAQWEQDLLSVQDTRSVPALNFDGATLRLTRQTPTGVQIVAWSLRNGAWWRWAGPAVTTAHELQDQWLVSQQLLGSEPGQLRVLEGLAAVQLYFYRVNGWANAQSSGDVAPSEVAASAPAARETLPTGVRLVLSFAEGGSLSGQLTRDIQLAPRPQP